MTHALCLPCWGELEPDRSPPVQISEVARDSEICCRCAQITKSGIYYRAYPATLLCLGRHAAARAEGPAAPDDQWQLAVDQLERNIMLPLGQIIMTDVKGESRQPFQPFQPFTFDREKWLPTQPGTMFELTPAALPRSRRLRRCRNCSRSVTVHWWQRCPHCRAWWP